MLQNSFFYGLYDMPPQGVRMKNRDGFVCNFPRCSYPKISYICRLVFIYSELSENRNKIT